MVGTAASKGLVTVNLTLNVGALPSEAMGCNEGGSTVCVSPTNCPAGTCVGTSGRLSAGVDCGDSEHLAPLEVSDKELEALRLEVQTLASNFTQRTRSRKR